MYVIRLSIIAGVLAALLVTPVQARSGRGEQRLREASLAYGDCVVRRNAVAARQVVLAEVPNDDIREDYRRLISTDCMSDAGRGGVAGILFRADSFRYMLAEGLVRLDYRASGPIDFTAVPRIDRPPVAALDEEELAGMGRRRQAELRESHRLATALRAMALLAECVARAAPEGVRSLALSEPQSADETQRFAVVQPAIAACLPPGESVRLDRSVLRGALLLNYYRLAHAVQPVAIAARD